MEDRYQQVLAQQNIAHIFLNKVNVEIRNVFTFMSTIQVTNCWME